MRLNDNEVELRAYLFKYGGVCVRRTFGIEITIL